MMSAITAVAIEQGKLLNFYCLPISGLLSISRNKWMFKYRKCAPRVTLFILCFRLSATKLIHVSPAVAKWWNSCSSRLYFIRECLTPFFPRNMNICADEMVASFIKASAWIDVIVTCAALCYSLFLKKSVIYKMDALNVLCVPLTGTTEKMHLWQRYVVVILTLFFPFCWEWMWCTTKPSVLLNFSFCTDCY